MKKVQLTQEGYDSLQAEYKDLKEVRQPKAVDTLQKARAMGDLSENSAYTAARDDLELVEGRIQEIEEILKAVEIVRNGHNHGLVAVGSRIMVDVDGKTEEFQIVGEFEANPMEKKISHSSPLGLGLVGKKVGDKVEIEVPAGKVIYTIMEVK